MAVGEGASSPEEYVMYVENGAKPQAHKNNRAALVLSALLLGMCAAVALVGVSGPTDARQTELLAGVDAHDSELAMGLLHAAPTATVAQLSQMLSSWKSQEISDMDGASSGSRTQMLSSAGFGSSLADSGKLCAKKDVIFEKLDQLVAKLARQGASLNASDAAAYKVKMEALGQWLDAESKYRLEVEKVKEAKEGAKFARQEYEKLAEAVKTTKERVAKMEKEYAKESEDNASEIALIKEIMRLLGILEDQPLDDKSKAAGGYMKPKEGDSKMGDKVVLKSVQHKISELRQKVAARGGAGKGKLTSLDQLSSKLASYAETDEIKKILVDMLKELQTRNTVMDSALADARNDLKKHMKKLTKYETNLVDLSNAADKSAQKAAVADLKRAKLDGKKKTVSEDYKDEHAAYLLQSPPTERELFIILVIKKKITDFCDKKK
eukprot:CAMPEP_0174916642 /NCGR_PEP_ID=MMETSP1355-20121228/1929_1 /TAXON_ID=464990 /ORGANISM="Hemiselmis tepida, Strain CCMP443" /LENGTH=436 /DNA_ID=CAMNT_0016161659 /DNA_START=11 /DNA_END=1321 /DNA_ORIENTATION=+